MFAVLLAAALQWLDPATIQPGQKGVCITEWGGGERREIPVEVLGTLEAAGPDREAVLVRLLDDRMATSGVVAGMSGSPVYIDGKLLGAVAFGWAFAKAPLAGVTPFAAMRRLSPGGASASAPAPTLTQLAALAASHLEPLALLPQLLSRGSAEPQLAALGGLPLPSGFAAEVLDRIGLRAVAAGGGASDEGPPQAGEMVAVPLVWGDASLAAAGTVTARDGDTIYAFGHPLFALGHVHLPAARARVLAVQDSYQNPFKIVSVGKMFGTLVTDRAEGVLAQVGEVPAGVPVTVAVQDATGAATWHFRIAEEPLLVTPLVTFLTHACLTARGAAVGEASVRLALTAHLADGRSASIEQAGRGLDILARVSAFAGAASGLLANSPFPHPALASLDIRLQREESAQGAMLIEAIPARTTLAPGDEVEVTVRLQPEHAAPLERRITVTVPLDSPPGPFDLIVADGAAWSEYRLHAEGIAPADFADELRQFAMLESSTTLVAALESRERGVALPGVSQPNLPPSWAATLAIGLGNRGVTRLATAVVAASRMTSDIPLEGAFRIPLMVQPRQETP
jgi:hypothetical protein